MSLVERKPQPEPKHTRAADGPVSALGTWSEALDATIDPAFVADRDGRLLFANRAAVARWPQATAGAPAAALFDTVSQVRFVAASAAVLAGEGAQRFEWGEEGPAGVAAGSSARSRRSRGPARRRRRDLCVSTDVTEHEAHRGAAAPQRAADGRHAGRRASRHLGVGHQPADATWSAELYRIYGLTPETYTPSYEDYLKMVHPDDRQRVIDATDRVFNEHVPYSHDERIFRPDGTMRYLHTWAHPVLDDAGKLTRLVGVCQDITDRKLAEEAVLTLNADLERRVAERTRTIETSMRDLEAFNAMASHDLRAPLAVIQAGCELMLHPRPSRCRRA